MAVTGRTRGSGRWMLALLVFLVVAVLARGRLVRPFVVVVSPDPVDHEVKFPVAGFSVYRETVLFAPLSGEITQLVSDGELVSRNTPLVRLDSPDAALAYRQRLSEVQQQVDTWAAEHQEVLVTAAGEAAEARNALTSSVLDLKAGGCARALHENTLRFESSHRTVVSLLAEWTTHRARIEDLRVLADRAQDQILSPRAGVARFKVDDLEKVLGWDEPLDPRLTEALLEWDGRTLDVSSTVVAGSPVVRVLDHTNLDAVLLVQRDGASLLHPGRTLRLSVDGVDQVIECSVKDIGSLRGEVTAVRVGLEHRLPFFFQRRAWEGNLTVAEISASMIPTGALITREGQCGVYTWLHQRPVWAPVEVLHQSAQAVVVTGLSREDSVVVNPALVEWFRLR